MPIARPYSCGYDLPLFMQSGEIILQRPLIVSAPVF
jgi:hypothetical protein